MCPVGAARVQTRSPVSRVDLMETAIIVAYWPNDPTDAGSVIVHQTMGSKELLVVFTFHALMELMDPDNLSRGASAQGCVEESDIAFA